MTLIQSPEVVGDPNHGVVASGPTTRWQGMVEAYIDEDIVDMVKNQQRVQISQTLIDLPANIPVWPNEEDLLTVVRSGVVARYAPAGPQTETLIVRKIDGGLLMLGKIRVYVVRD